MARASTDFYGALGWMVGLLITLLIPAPVLWFLATNASRSSRESILATGIAIAWWFNPLSLGALGYVLINGLIVGAYILLALLFLYIQLRVFI